MACDILWTRECSPVSSGRDGVKPDTQGLNDKTLLWWAAASGAERRRSKLQGGDYPGLLWWAATNGHEAVVRLLLKREDVKPDVQNQLSFSPLLEAVIKRHEVIVQLLLERNDADPNTKSCFGQTPLSLVA